ncbi:MAG: Stp1/IreP family PP2C-type Ser/Thr phosphatase [Defluviitaleaceae bacterium]|nr:Stp1/IreP family PP2C-type Ser/Thr phosphatase [Defluviitaleaceae bacterium]
MKALGLSDVGLVRTKNEDSFIVITEPINILENLLIVADGMGGHKAGEIASSLSVKTFVEHIKNTNFSEEQILDNLTDGVRVANYEVLKLSSSNPDFEGMGTTFTACSIYNNKLYVSHIGDSRLYVINDDGITQITHDHSYVAEILKSGEITKEEAKVHPRRNALTRAIGISSEVEVDGFLYSLKKGDKVLICSDGLTDMIDENEILQIVENKSLEDGLKELIYIANKNGGMDNITAILAEIEEV